MVAGFISALDNSIGWVGIAPGARLWDVRVLGQGGTANNSQVICGIDWVTSTRTDADPANDMAGCANMSLAGPGTDDGNCGLTDRSPVHMAICGSVAAGVTYVVAAGNEDTDLAGFEAGLLSGGVDGHGHSRSRRSIWGTRWGVRLPPWRSKTIPRPRSLT